MTPEQREQLDPDGVVQPAFGGRAFQIGLFVILVAGALLHSPTLGAPLVLDDYAQRAMIEGSLTKHRGPLNLYAFVDDANRVGLMERGALPWWTDPLLTIRFFRPLASALVWLDHRLFGYESGMPHVLSLCWWAAAVVAVALLFRSVMSPRAALIASAVFALSPCHTIPLVWLANRSVLVALVFGALGLRSYLAWRLHQRPLNALTAGLLLLAAFLCGEYAAALLGYVFASECLQPSQSFRQRAVGVSPAVVPAAVVTLAIFLLDYRTGFSGFYTNPITDFGAYLGEAPLNFLSAFGSAWFGLADNWSTTASRPLWGLMLLGTTLLAYAWASTRLAAAPRTTAIWLLVGSLLASLPLLAARPSWRLLGPVVIGVAGFVGVLFDVLTTRFIGRRQHRSNLLGAAICLVVAYVHLFRCPSVARAAAHAAITAEKHYDDRFLWVLENVQPSDSMVILLRAALPPSVLWTPFLLGSKTPVRWFAVGLNPSAVTAVRTGPKSLEVRHEEGPLAPCGRDDLFNTRGIPVGHTVKLPGVHATILATDATQCPTHVRFEFDRDLDDGFIRWIAESQSGFQEVVRPPVGIGVRLTP